MIGASDVTIGLRVRTKDGRTGAVQFWRFAPPKFQTLAGISVKIDGLNHAGAMYAPGDLTKEEA